MPKARKRQRTEQAAALGDATRVDDKDDEELALEDAVFGSAPAGRTRKAARESEDGDDALGELNDNDVRTSSISSHQSSHVASCFS